MSVTLSTVRTGHEELENNEIKQLCTGCSQNNNCEIDKSYNKSIYSFEILILTRLLKFHAANIICCIQTQTVLFTRCSTFLLLQWFLHV